MRKKKGKSAAKKSAKKRVVAKKTAKKAIKKVGKQAKVKAKTVAIKPAVAVAHAHQGPCRRPRSQRLRRGQCRFTQADGGCTRCTLADRSRSPRVRYRRPRPRRHSEPRRGPRRSPRPRRWAGSVLRIPGTSRTSNPAADAPRGHHRCNNMAGLAPGHDVFAAARWRGHVATCRRPAQANRIASVAWAE